MNLLKKTISLLISIAVLSLDFKIHAKPTPVLNSLTPNLQSIMRLYGERQSFDFWDGETVDEYAEHVLNKCCVTIDGNLYKGHGGPMKLTNEDIESPYNLPNVKQLDLERFDLENVDINRFLGINNNQTIEIVLLNDCFFDIFDKEQIAARIKKRIHCGNISLHLDCMARSGP